MLQVTSNSVLSLARHPHGRLLELLQKSGLDVETQLTFQRLISDYGNARVRDHQRTIKEPGCEFRLGDT